MGSGGVGTGGGASVCVTGGGAVEKVKQVEVEVVVQVRWKEYVNLLQVEWGPMHEREKGEA